MKLKNILRKLRSSFFGSPYPMRLWFDFSVEAKNKQEARKMVEGVKKELGKVLDECGIKKVV